MSLFRKEPNAVPNGQRVDDPLVRFDRRLLVEVSMRERNWCAHVQLDGVVHQDPLPPRFALRWSDQMDVMRLRASHALSRRKADVRLRSLSSATEYYDRKVSRLLAVVAPSFPAIAAPSSMG